MIEVDDKGSRGVEFGLEIVLLNSLFHLTTEVDGVVLKIELDRLNYRHTYDGSTHDEHDVF